MRKTTLSPAYFFSPANINIMKSERKLQRKARGQGAAQTHPRGVDDERDADDLDRLGQVQGLLRKIRDHYPHAGKDCHEENPPLKGTLENQKN